MITMGDNMSAPAGASGSVINLSKGAKINLSKEAPGLKKEGNKNKGKGKK